MDKKTKKKLSKYATELSAMLERIKVIEGEVEEMASDEHNKFDNAPEGLQSSDKFSEIEQIADELDAVVEDSFYDATCAIEEIIDTFKSINNEIEPEDVNAEKPQKIILI